MTAENDITTRTRARWLRQRLAGMVSPDILSALSDEELIEQYDEKQRRKLEELKAKHNSPREK